MADRARQTIKTYALLTVGTLLLAAGIYFFKFPNHFSTGGVSGIAIVLAHYLPNLSAGSFMLIINVALLLVGFLVLGRTFGLRTAYCSLLYSGIVQVLEWTVPMTQPMTTQPMLELFFAVGLPAIASALLFHLDASSGGTDIVAMILRKYTNLNIGNALMAADLIITVAACVAFGMETGLYSILGLVLKAVVLDVVLDNFRTKKCFQIITSNPEPIVDFIVKNIKRGATISAAKGAYNHEERTMILTIMNRSQALQLRRYARDVDPNSFIIITNSTEIVGKGFLRG